MRRLVALPLVLLVGLFLAMAPAVPASAHTSLVGVDPAEGTTVAAGGSITLTFSETLLTIGAEASVTDAAGAVTKLDVTFPTPTSAQVVLPAVAAGKLTLAWRVVAGDGHPVEGTLAYVADAAAPATANNSATPSAPAAASPSSSVSPTPLIAPAPSGSASPSAAPSTSKGASSGTNVAALMLALGAALFVTIMAIVAAKRRR